MKIEKNVHALYVHGIGSEGPHFAYEPSSRLREVCQRRKLGYEARFAHWAPVTEKIQNEYLKSIEEHGSVGNFVQKQTIKTLSDATLYLANDDICDAIINIVDEQMTAFYRHPVVVFTHSLGALIFTNWLRRKNDVDLASRIKLVTLGCNVGMFKMGGRFEQIAGLSDWISLFDKDDGLAFPLKAENNFSFVNEHQVNVGITALSHTKYWSDNSLWEETIPKLVF